MGPSGEHARLASWYAFLAKAFLSADPGEVGRFVLEMKYRGAPGTEAGRLLEGMDAALNEDAESLAQEYVRLFANPAGAACPPWQSLYTGDKRAMGPPHRGALAWYHAAGFEPKSPAEAADHIGLLLGFYARLLELPGSEEVRQAFYEEHLSWIPGFCERLILETRHPFYRLLAEAARESLQFRTA